MPIISDQKQVAQNLTALFRAPIEITGFNSAYEVKTSADVLEKLFKIILQSNELKYSVDPIEYQFTKNDWTLDAKFSKSNSLFQKVFLSSKAVSYVQSFIDMKVKMYQSEKYREYLLSVGVNSKLEEKDFQNEILKIATSVDKQDIVDTEFSKFVPKAKMDHDYSDQKRIAEALSALFQSQIEITSLKYAYEIKASNDILDRIFKIIQVSNDLQYSVTAIEDECIKNDSISDAKFLKSNMLYQKVVMKLKALSHLQKFIDEKVNKYQSGDYSEYLRSIGDNSKLSEEDFLKKILNLVTNIDLQDAVEVEFRKFIPRSMVKEGYVEEKLKELNLDTENQLDTEQKDPIVSDVKNDSCNLQ